MFTQVTAASSTANAVLGARHCGRAYTPMPDIAHHAPEMGRGERQGTRRGQLHQAKPADPRPDDLLVTDLVTRAGNGDRQAWDTLVERYAPLIWSICRRHGLGRADTEEVGQAVWLHLVGHLGSLREPAALPGWLATTARRECLRVLRAGRPLAAWQVLHAETLPDDQAGMAEQELLAAERQAALREAFLDLPPCGQRLIALLVEDPPVPYAEISVRLGIPVGSIGPYRHRYLDKMRDHPAIAALINAEGRDRAT
jgi:RNA polymerase sigma factor (sigma-70 family)